MLREDTVVCVEGASRPAKGSPDTPPPGPVEASSPGSSMGWFLVRGLQQSCVNSLEGYYHVLPLEDQVPLPKGDVEGDLQQAVVQSVIQVVRL